MGQKIIQGDLVVSGSISLAPISSDTLVYSLECDKEYTVAWSGRYQIKKIIVNNWGGRVLQVFKKDDKYYYISAAEGQTIGETLEQLNTVNEDQWSCAISADQVGFNTTTVEDTLQTLEDEVVNIREVAEGKTKTYILDTTWDIQWVLTWLQHNQNISHFTNAQGENLVEAVLSGQYNNVTIANSNFNSQEQTLAIGTAISTEYLIVSTTSKSVYNSPYTVWILDTLDNIFKNGDIILVTQTDVPDRWCGRGVKPTFYALETRKIELPAVNDGKLSIQLGGTEKASFTANQSGDTTLNITKTDITNLGIPSENTWRPVQNNLTSTSTTDALSAAQGKALNEKFSNYATNTYLEDCLKGCITSNSTSQAKSGNLTLSGILYMGEGLPSIGDGSKIYRNKDLILNRRSAGISGMYANSAQTNLFYGLAYNPKYLCTCSYKGDGEHTTTTVGDGNWQAYKYSNSEDKSGYVAYLFDGSFTTGATFPVDQLATKPVVLTVTTTGGENIDATDTLYVTLNGWRYEGYSSSGNYYGSVSGFYLEILDSTTNTWVKSFEYNGDPINMDSISFPVFSTVAKETLGITSTYTFIKGIRLTITSATAGSSGKFGITEFKLMETRPAGKPSNGVGAVDAMGGTLYGDLNLASKYLDSKIQPQINNTNYLGTNTNQWRGIYGKTIYEDGTSLADKYQSKFTSSNKLSTDYISGLATVATSGSYTDLTNKPTIPSAVTEDTVAGWGFTKNTGTSTFSGSYTDLTNKPTLFSGDYKDLSNKPSIPSEVTETTVAGWGFTKNTGTSNFSGSYNDLTNKPTILTLGTTSTTAAKGDHTHTGYLKGSISNGVLTITE